MDILVALVVMVVLYKNIKNKNLLFRCTYAVLTTSALLFLAGFLWSYFHLKEPLFVWIEKNMTVYFEQAKPLLGKTAPDIKTLVYQVPSMVVTFLGLAMWLVVLFDSIVQRKKETGSLDKEIKDFRAPDEFIWVIIAALLFSFLKTPVPWVQEVALNILNVALLLYFFQGLSTLSFLISVLNFGALLKGVVYFIFIAQLALPICLGILDFWLNFRHKLSKSADDKF